MCKQKKDYFKGGIYMLGILCALGIVACLARDAYRHNRKIYGTERDIFRNNPRIQANRRAIEEIIAKDR